MALITSKTQTFNYAEGISDVLWDIDKELSCVAEKKLVSKRFGAKDCTDPGRFFILLKYRELLLEKANGSCCLEKFSIDGILSNIKQYLSKGKLFKETL